MEPLKTYQDAYSFLLDQYNITDARSARVARNAILAAQRQFPLVCEWSYYYRRWTFQTEEPYTEGTVSYTHSTRTVTLTDGTWPEWAEDGRIKIVDRVYYPVQSVNGQDLILAQDNNPGKDLDPGQSYHLVKDQYQLPVDFHRMAGLFEVAGRFQLTELSSAMTHAYQVYWEQSSRPLRFTIDADFRYLGALQLRLVPVPAQAKTYDVTYKAKMRPLRTQQISTTGSIAQGTTTLVLADPVAQDYLVGSVVRFSATTEAPTGLEGVNPYIEYRIISSVTNSTTVELDAPVSNGYAAKAVEISDLIDIEASTMWEAFKAMVNWQYCVAERAQSKGRKEARAEYEVAVREAMAADWRNTGDMPAPRRTPWDYHRWSTVPVEDVQP